MGAVTGISWTDHTQNFWWGCARVSPGCEHCYAEEWAGRFGTKWGVNAKRREFGDSHWNEPFKWNKAAEREGRRHRVFCSSMADVFDMKAPEGARERMWPIIKATDWLDWQLLTKRPQNALSMLPKDWGDGYPNVWLGVTTENQEWADKRLAILRTLPARTKFASYEPALEVVDFRAHLDMLHWVIVGGESGAKARPFDPAWALAVIKQCKGAGVAAFHKQMGEPWANERRARVGKMGQRHGANPMEWDEPFRVQEFPRSVAVGHATVNQLTARRSGGQLGLAIVE